MMTEELRHDLKQMAKVELHHHLEGAAPPAFVRGIASEKGVDVSGIFDEKGAYKYRDFGEFLKVYEAAVAPLTKPEDYKRLTRAVLEEAAAENVIYVESFLSPEFCGGGDVSAWREFMHAMQEGAAEVPEVELRGVLTVIRHFGPERARATALCAQETVGDFVVGFGIAGDEMAGHPSDFAYAFDMAREAGLRLTAHAGEWGGAKSVRDAVEHLGVERVGHGVHAVNDPKLMADLAARDIVLEVCPGSNVALGVYPSIKDHPIAKLRDAGVKVTVSTDDPPFFHTDMTAEYVALAEAFGWGVEDFLDLGRVAARAAFCDEQTKTTLLSRLEG